MSTLGRFIMSSRNRPWARRARHPLKVSLTGQPRARDVQNHGPPPALQAPLVGQTKVDI
jgi:hypothetical protein